MLEPSDEKVVSPELNRRTTFAPLPMERQFTNALAIEFKTLSVREDETRIKTKYAKGEADFHKMSAAEVALALNTSVQTGLTSNSAKTRLTRYGKNILSPPPTDWFRRIMEYLFGGFCGILWFAALICFLAWRPIGNPPDPTNLGLGIVLILVILLQAGFSAYQDWNSTKVMSSISGMLATTASVTRNGENIIIPADQIVPGDLITLSYGGKVPADLRILESSDLSIDRSILTGETDPIGATLDQTDENYLETKNIAFMGTLVVDGSGRGIVVATGDNTIMGKIANLSRKKPEKSILQLEIQRFVLIIAIMALTTSILVFVLWAVWLRTSYPGFISLSNAFVNSIAVLVAFLPDGLPVAVTLTLTLIARKMQRQRVLVKNLTTVETLGCVNIICSDKTGTLTQGKMFVTSAFSGDGEFSIDETATRGTRVMNELVRVASLCNGATFDPSTLKYPIHERKVIGNATDAALLRFSEEHGGTFVSSGFTKLREIPFNSRNKWMMTLYRQPKQDNDGRNLLLLMVKGAPDYIIGNCTKICGEEQDRPIDRDIITAKQMEWGQDGQRVLLLAQRELEEQPLPEDLSTWMQDLTLVGMLGITDPPRLETAGVVQQCKEAGIRVFMVTGDFHTTAASIAKQVSIITHSTVHSASDLIGLDTVQVVVGQPVAAALVLTGSDLYNLTNVQWDQVSRYEQIVFARTSPEQKLIIVQEFQKRGFIMGMTGDGVNDSPALKHANIGIAMGEGSEVAREAAHMVLLDNNFSSIIVALANGRLVYDNLKKVILYLLPAGSWAELLPILVNVLLGVPLPLSPFWMIVICMLTDMLPSIAMVFEQAESDLLKRPPRRIKKDRLVNLKLLVHAYLFLGTLEAFYSHCMYFYYMQLRGFRPSDLLLAYDKWTDGYRGRSSKQLAETLYTGQSVYFVTLVMMQIFGNLLATRTRKLSLFQHPYWRGRNSKNRWLIAAQVGTFMIALLLVYVPFFNEAFNTRPVPIQFWFLPLGGAMGLLLLEELRKLVIRTWPKGFFARNIAW